MSSPPRWQLQNAAGTAYGQASLQDMLRGVRVAQAMTHECARVPFGLSIDRLVHDEILGAGRRCFVVTNNGHLQGLLSLAEVKAVPRERWVK